MYTYTSNSFIVTNKNAVVLEPMFFFSKSDANMEIVKIKSTSLLNQYTCYSDIHLKYLYTAIKRYPAP